MFFVAPAEISTDACAMAALISSAATAPNIRPLALVIDFMSRAPLGF
jgi:hypothetical protein